MRNRDGISIKPILDTRRVKNNGLYPVKICVIYKCVAKYYPANIDLAIDDWNQMVSAGNTVHSELHKHIKERLDLVCGIIDALSEKQLFSFDTLKKEFVRLTSPSYFADHRDEI